MAVLATDDFNRADSADFGTNWTVTTGDAAWRITSNTARVSNVDSDCSEYYNAGTWPNDQYSKFKLTTAPDNTIANDIGIGPGCRFSTSARTYYRSVGGTVQGCHVAKFVAGAITTIASSATDFANGDIIQLEAVGTTIRLLQNSVQITSNTDSAIATGRPGVCFSSSTSSVPVVDDWEGGDFASTFTPIMQRVYGVTVVRAAYH